MTDLRKVAQQALEALETCDAAHPSDGGAQWYDVNAVDASITALRAALAQPDVPEGWVLVPVEPTKEMRVAGKHAMKGSADELYETNRALTVYGAMLAAAPKGGA